MKDDSNMKFKVTFLKCSEMNKVTRQNPYIYTPVCQ